jgi:hypothetical protein
VRLRDDSNALNAAINDVVDRTLLPWAQVEKDFWLTEALRRMASIADAERFTLLLKGGTSLSKAFRLIERFSEDVDLLVVLPTGSKGAQDRLLRRLIDEAAEACGLPAMGEPTGTTKAVKRAARLHYPAVNDRAGTSRGLLLELGSRGGTMPHQRLTIRSLLAEHSSADLSDVDEAAPFGVSVLSPARTLVEKLVLLHTAHAGGDEGRVEKTARHYYDVFQLLGRPEIVAEVAAHGIDALARDVVVYSTAADLPASARPASGFATSPAFDETLAPARLASSSYATFMRNFGWPNVQHPTFDECLARVHASATDL